MFFSGLNPIFVVYYLKFDLYKKQIFHGVIMRNEYLLKMMKENNFKDKDIRRITEQSIKRGLTLQHVLYDLAEAFTKLLRMHALLNIIVVVILVLNHNEMTLSNIVGLFITYVIVFLVFEGFSPIGLSYKSFKIRKKFNFIVKGILS